MRQLRRGDDQPSSLLGTIMRRADGADNGTNRNSEGLRHSPIRPKDQTQGEAEASADAWPAIDDRVSAGQKAAWPSARNENV